MVNQLEKFRKQYAQMALILGLFCLATFAKAETPPINGTFSTSSIHFNMDACSAYATQNTNFDYTEFTGEVTNSSTCLQMSVVGGHLYRDEPLRNPHSCTAGVNGSNAMCVSSVMDCNYPAGHMRSVKIDVQVVPGSDGTGSLSSISFYEQAPFNYSWIDGASGLNNYPTLYGIRVLKDGTEIYRSEGNMTTADWTLESFSFLNDPAFTVSSTSVFTFELIGYCLVNNGSLVSAWDLDEITIESSCGTVIDGGSLALPGGGTSTSICVGTGQAAPVNVNLTGNQSPSGGYVITDDSGNILALPPGGPPFDLDGAGTGTCLIWYAAFDGALTGLEVGANASDIEGCFDLSNPVTVNRFTASGGTISSPGGNMICAGGNMLVDIDVTGAVGSTRWVITDTNGNILGLPMSPPFDLSQYSGSQCVIWNLGYSGNITGLAVGSNAKNITGDCFSLSNPITVSKMSVRGGVLSSGGVTYINLCEGNGSSNVVDLTLNNTQGPNNQIVLTDANGNIIDANPSLPYDFSSSQPGEYNFYNVSWLGTISGITAGSNINNLDGFCYDVSNSVTIDKERASGGTISTPRGDNFDICIEGNVSDPIDISLTGNQGEFSRWVITNPAGDIVGLPTAPPITLDPSFGSPCLIWHLGFESSFRGLFIGQNVSEFDGCFALSNSITVTKRSASAGTITQGGFSFIDICGNTGSQVINIDNSGAVVGANLNYVVTDASGTIVNVSSSPTIDFSSYANGSYNIVLVASHSTASGLNVGGNIADVTSDCIDFSNEMTINKYNPASGTITSPSGGVIDVCNDGVDDMIDVTLTGNSGGFQRWVLADANGNIIGLPNSAPFSFEGYPAGTCFLYSLSYENGIGGLNIGGNTNSFTGCFAISNSIQINKQSLSGGSISTNGGVTSVSVCLEDNLPDVVTVANTGQNAPNGTYVITDDQGNILELAAGPDFDFANAGSGVCRIYFIGYDDIGGLAAGTNLDDLTGCFAISNSISVFRNSSNGGTLTSSGGLTNITVCVSDGSADLVDVQLTGATSGGTNTYLITDAAGNIVALPGAPPFDFDGAGTGVCYIWNINYTGNLTGLEVGANVSGLEGCFGLSNSITVNRFDVDNAASTSSITYNMNACSALTGSTQFDYNDMVPTTNNSPTCTQLTGGILYREDPTNFPHSCTPGVGGTPAICVSSLDACTYEADSDYALRFDITVTPGGNGTGSISSLSFYEAAPLNFTWLSGTTGINNYPTLYGVRVLRDGVEIWRQEGQATTNDYTLENFDFSSNPDFTVTTTTQFSFELLGYCLAGVVGSPATAWDIDDLTVQTNCSGGLNGGDLTISGGAGGTSMEICADDGIDDIVSLNLLNSSGPIMGWVITDEMGTIIGMPASFPFNFEGAGGGTCLVYNIAYINGLTGLNMAGNLSNLQGCYSLSNPVSIIRNVGAECTQPLIVNGGEIFTIQGLTQESHCVDDGIADYVDVQVQNNLGTGSSWIITDENGVIADIPTSFPYDFEGTGLGRAFIYHIGYEGDLENMSKGNTIDMIEGNFEFSNAVMVDRTECSQTTSSVVNDYANDVALYPNPAGQELTIKNTTPSKFGSKVYLYNSQGQIIGAYFVGNEPIKVDVSNYSEGFYYIKMISGENEKSKSFSKM